MNEYSNEVRRVVIVGGGVAGAEATLALHDLAGARVRTTLLAPNPRLVVRATSVLEPFSEGSAIMFPLDELAADADTGLLVDRFAWLEGDARRVHTETGDTVDYDALLLALGARMRPAFKHALTIDDARIDDQLHGLVQDVEDGYVNSIAFLMPRRMPWPLPLYELALMTARRARDMCVELSVTLITAEPEPLTVFGPEASTAVGSLLEAQGIAVLTGARASTPAPGEVALDGPHRRLHFDRIVALPELTGPPTPGVPKFARDSFLSTDAYGHVVGLTNVWAAGDATALPVKHGGIAAQQADVAAQGIAALAGADVEPHPLAPAIQGVLLSGGAPLYLSARLTGSIGSHSQASAEPLLDAQAKTQARYLAPYLRRRLGAGVLEGGTVR